MYKKAVVVKFVGAVIKGSLKEIEPMPGVVEAIKRLSQEFDVYIYSGLSKENIGAWLYEFDLLKNVYGFFGRDGFRIKEYFTALEKQGYEIFLYLSDEPLDFIVDHKGLIKVAVNASPNNVFPEDVYVYRQSLTTDLIEQFMEG